MKTKQKTHQNSFQGVIHTDFSKTKAPTSVLTWMTPSSVRVLVSMTGNPSVCKSINIFWEQERKEVTHALLFLQFPREQIALFHKWKCICKHICSIAMVRF